MKPLYKHDCDECKFVKVGKDIFGEVADIYICKGVVIYRLGDEPSENKAVSMRIAQGFPDSYRSILDDVDIMNAYFQVNKLR